MPNRLFVLILIMTTAMLMLASGGAYAHYEGELLPDSVAVMEYQMEVSMAPKNTLVRNKLGMVYIRQKKLVKAREQFVEILKIDKANFDALDSLGLVSDMEGKFAEAVGWYTKALDVKKGDPGVMKRIDAAKGKMKGAKK